MFNAVRRRAVVAVVSTATAATSSSTLADQLGTALELVPADAVAWAVAPSLSRFNADLGDLIDRADRPELAVAGRPVDVLVSQFGLAAGFDERGSLAIWSPTVDDLLLGHGVVAVPVEDAGRFIDANIRPAPEVGPNAGRLADGTLLHHRAIADHVLLAPRPELLGDVAQGYPADRLASTFGTDAAAAMRRADLVLRIDGAALARVQEAARDFAEEEGGNASPDLPFAPGGVDPSELFARFERIGGGATDIAVAVDADALALGVRGWTRYADGSAVATLATDATLVSRPVLSSLPEGPYYLAFGVDVASFGGGAGVRRLAGVLGEDLVSPEAAAIADELDAVAFATRPSKLGVAMGGILNDASLVLVSDDPQATRDRVESTMLDLGGVQGAIERTVDFKRDVEQRRGGVADQITMNADVALEERREAGSRLGDASIQLTAERMVFGPRGWLGLGRVVDGAYVVTFSRRPDVMNATVGAADGIERVGADGRGLATDPTLLAMREWLPAKPGLEMFLDVGRLVGLARQVASLVPGADGMIPEVPEAMPPIGFAMGLRRIESDAVLGWGLVVPSEVMGAAIGTGIEQAMSAGGVGAGVGGGAAR